MPVAPLKDYYRTLHVEPHSSPRAIKTAYRRLSKIYHPDAAPKRDSNREMQDINEAYEVLSNPLLRLRYDFARAAASRASRTTRLPIAPLLRGRRWAAPAFHVELRPLLNFIDAILNSRWFTPVAVAILLTVFLLLPPDTRQAITIALMTLVNPSMGMH
jgi:hypothetical protein